MEPNTSWTDEAEAKLRRVRDNTRLARAAIGEGSRSTARLHAQLIIDHAQALVSLLERSDNGEAS